MLQIHPEAELVFSEYKQQITLTNPGDGLVSFKVKTTAPKLYSVRPGSGKLEPKQQALIQVVFTSKEPDYTRKDKFQIQAIKLPLSIQELDADSQNAKIQELWSQADQLAKNFPESDVLFQHRLRCVLPNDYAKLSKPEELESPFSGVSQTDVVTPVAAIEPEEPTKPPNHQELEDAKEKIKNLQAACDAYKAEIEKMKHLRHRRTGSGTISAAISAQKQVSEKETPSWVLFIVIIAFLVGAWLF